MERVRVKEISDLDTVIKTRDITTLYLHDLEPVKIENQELSGLIHSSQNGDRKALTRLFLGKSYIPFQEAIKSSQRLSWDLENLISVDDLIQEANLALIRAILHYNRTAVGFDTFARKVSRNALTDLVRKNSKGKNTAHPKWEIDGLAPIAVSVQGRSLNEPRLESESGSDYIDFVISGHNTELEALEYEDLKANGDIDDVLDELKDEDRKLIELYFGLNGLPTTSLEEIARKRGVNEGSMYKRMYRLLKKMRSQIALGELLQSYRKL